MEELRLLEFFHLLKKFCFWKILGYLNFFGYGKNSVLWKKFGFMEKIRFYGKNSVLWKKFGLRIFLVLEKKFGYLNFFGSGKNSVLWKKFCLRIFMVLEKILLFEFFRLWKKFGFMEKILFKNFQGLGKNSVI